MLRTGGCMVCVGMPPMGQAIAGGDPNMLIMKGKHTHREAADYVLMHLC